MCLIVDNNCMFNLLDTANNNDFDSIKKALHAGKARLVYGGQLLRELIQNHAVMDLLTKYDQAGRARRIPDGHVDQRAEELRAGHACISNDEHIIALAQVSKVRLLCTHDTRLQTDFTNSALLSNPRGKIYKNKDHDRLLSTRCKHIHHSGRRRKS